jgi:hypothetical protein
MPVIWISKKENSHLFVVLLLSCFAYRCHSVYECVTPLIYFVPAFSVRVKNFFEFAENLNFSLPAKRPPHHKTEPILYELPLPYPIGITAAAPEPCFRQS